MTSSGMTTDEREEWIFNKLLLKIGDLVKFSNRKYCSEAWQKVPGKVVSVMILSLPNPLDEQPYRACRCLCMIMLENGRLGFEYRSPRSLMDLSDIGHYDFTDEYKNFKANLSLNKSEK